jgi:hypothetical protein
MLFILLTDADHIDFSSSLLSPQCIHPMPEESESTILHLMALLYKLLGISFPLQQLNNARTQITLVMCGSFEYGTRRPYA